MSFPEFRLEVIEECGSTNELLLARRDRADFPGTALLALRQTAGHGRRGRAWQSPEGNLALSIAFRLESGAFEAPLLSFYVGVAAYRALRPLLPREELRLKWPNDIYLNGLKLAGMLAQAKQQGSCTDVVVGIGLNLAQAPRGLDQETTAVSEYALAPAPEDFARRLLEELHVFGQNAGGFEALRDAWEVAAGLESLECTIVGEAGIWRAVQLLPSGELEVRGQNGQSRNLSSEEVSIRFRSQ